MEDIITVVVGQEDFAHASSFVDNFHCPLAEALQRMFLGKSIYVGISIVSIEGKDYCIQSIKDIPTWGISHPDLNQIDQYIKQAKKGYPVPSFVIELIPVS